MPVLPEFRDPPRGAIAPVPRRDAGSRGHAADSTRAARDVDDARSDHRELRPARLWPRLAPLGLASAGLGSRAGGGFGDDDGGRQPCSFSLAARVKSAALYEGAILIRRSGRSFFAAPRCA